jgi:energy-converting hydrogenase Eha subunit B
VLFKFAGPLLPSGNAEGLTTNQAIIKIPASVIPSSLCACIAAGVSAGAAQLSTDVCVMRMTLSGGFYYPEIVAAPDVNHVTLTGISFPYYLTH